MYHLLAFRGTVADVANTEIAGIQDQVVSRNPSTNRFMLPAPMLLWAMTAFSATINRARVNMPSYRLIALPQIRPVMTGLRPTDQHILQLLLDQPMRMQENEELIVEGTSDVGAGGEPMTALLWVGPQLDPVPPGDVYTLRATSTTAAVANTWTQTPMTLEQTLPPGNYALISSEHISATGYAHRWFFPNQTLRPGGCSAITLGARPNHEFNNRLFGKMGEFLNTVLPTPEVLCTAADAAHTFFLQVVKIG